MPVALGSPHRISLIVMKLTDYALEANREGVALIRVDGEGQVTGSLC